MSSDFATEVAAFYKTKAPYKALLKEATAKPRPDAKDPRNEKTRQGSDDRRWGKTKVTEAATFEAAAASSADYEAIVETQAAARKNAAPKGKSGGKKKK